MLPKKSKHFINPTAKKLDLDPDLVDDVVSFFYSGIRKSLIEMEGPNIQIENLGSFKAKQNELPKLVAKYTKHLDVLKPETFNQMTLMKELQSKLARVLNLQKIIGDEKARKTKFKEQKNAKKANQNME